MYLFRTVDDKVEVYELTPKEDEIKSYKEKQLSLLDRKKRFMEHTTNREKLYSKDGIVHCGSFNKNDPKDVIGLGYSDMFSYQDETEYTRILHHKFINNDYKDLEAFKLYKVIGGRNKKESGRLYLLVSEYYDNKYNKKSILHNIMVLPKTLFIVRSLETGRLDLIEDEDISKELELFDIQFVKSIDLDNISDLVKYGLVEDALEKTQEKIEDSEEVLKLKLK